MVTELLFLVFFLGGNYGGGEAKKFGLTFPSNFRLTAFLDAGTGIATAKENSDLELVSDVLDEVIEEVFCSYPEWLASPKVTFRLLRACPVDNLRDAKSFRLSRKEGGRHDFSTLRPHARQSIKGVSICDGILRMNLLTFGEARSKIVIKHGCGSRFLIVDFPVIGGLLAVTGAASSRRDDGFVRFVLIQRKNASRRWRCVGIESQICGNYRPALAGAAPVHPLRKALYLSSQSLVHAYVMWRFHGRAASRMIESIETQTS
jgi:hypothetical protein